MGRDRDLSSLRQARRVVVCDGRERERVRIGGGSGGVAFELRDRGADDGGRQLGRVDHDSVVLVVCTTVDRHGRVRLSGNDCLTPDSLPPLDALVQRLALDLVHHVLSILVWLCREEVRRGRGSGCLALALCPGGRGRGRRLGRLLAGVLLCLCGSRVCGQETVRHGPSQSECE